MRLFIQILAVIISLFPTVLLAISSPTYTKEIQSLHLDWIDKSIDRSQNFFQFANGNWMKNNPIPAGFARWSIFQVLQEQNNERIHQLLQTLVQKKHLQPGSNAQKIADFYFSGMNEKLINQMHAQPLMPEFERINKIKNTNDLQEVITHLQMIGVNALFKFDSMQDFKNSQNVIGVAFQGGLGLPDRDYYLKSEEKFKKIRQLYLQHIARMMELLGDSQAQAVVEANTVMRIETILAKASMPLIEQRNPYAIYNMMTVKHLEKITPHFSWKKYFLNIGHPEIKQINLAMPLFFQSLDQQMTRVALKDWKVYLRWHLIDTFASFLSEPFVKEDFQMEAELTGKKMLLPRWKRVVNHENELLGYAIGKLYVEQTFSQKSKQEAEKILGSIRQVLKQNLENLAWMMPQTRAAALKKLNKMEARIGYPDKWRDYSALKVDRGAYALNVMRANQFLIQYELNKIGKPVDRQEWNMTPQTVNAYYNPSLNQLTIPAGILEPPFFSADAPAAVNYGGIGSTIAHEMVHGFDDQGAQFDENGNLKNWWTNADLQKFQAITKCVADQFSEYTVSGVHVKGQLVVGEALADLGGMKMAYQALHLTDANKEKNIAGYTLDQQFFLSAAHTWAHNIHNKEAQLLTMTNPHPLPIHRVNGTLANMPQFRDAFQIKDQSPMINKRQCNAYP